MVKKLKDNFRLTDALVAAAVLIVVLQVTGKGLRLTGKDPIYEIGMIIGFAISGLVAGLIVALIVALIRIFNNRKQ